MKSIIRLDSGEGYNEYLKRDTATVEQTVIEAGAAIASLVGTWFK